MFTNVSGRQYDSVASIPYRPKTDVHLDNKDDLLVSGFDALRVSLKQRQAKALALAVLAMNASSHSVTRCSRTPTSTEPCLRR
jgi:hypothetical protein